VKTSPDGSPLYKARLVAQGFTQIYGIDYDETTAPVVRLSTVRTLLAIASKRKLPVIQFDVKTAFLNGTLSEDIYMKMPPGSKQAEKVLKLHKSIYGLKQAANVWNKLLNASLLNAGFYQSKHDDCLYILREASAIIYAVCHVDDLLFATTNLKTLDEKVKFLNKSFTMKNLGQVENYLGIEVTRDSEGVYSICQKKYIEKIAEEYQLTDCKSSKYPMDPGYHKLVSDEPVESSELRKIVGSLLYVANNTRPDISAAVDILSQRVAKPRKLDMNEALRVVRYLVSTKNNSLKMYDKESKDDLVAYSDSDWAECRETRKSISGMICKVFGGSVSWSSRKQDVVAMSTTEAEFYALAEGVKELLWLKMLLKDFDVCLEGPLIIHSDNQSTIKLLENPKFSARLKHIDCRLHSVRDYVQKKILRIFYVPTAENIADLLTKPLAGTKIKVLSELVGLFNPKSN
jgi:hypothetical protein